MVQYAWFGLHFKKFTVNKQTFLCSISSNFKHFNGWSLPNGYMINNLPSSSCIFDHLSCPFISIMVSFFFTSLLSSFLLQVFTNAEDFKSKQDRLTYLTQLNLQSTWQNRQSISKQIWTYLRDIAGLVIDHRSEVSITIKWIKWINE